MTSMESLPVLYVRAESHYEVGRSIGTTFKTWITEYLDTEDGQLLRKFYQTEPGRALYDGHLAASRQCCPNIIRELEGMADGADIDFTDLFLLQLTSEILFVYSNDSSIKDAMDKHETKGCIGTTENIEDKHEGKGCIDTAENIEDNHDEKGYIDDVEDIEDKHEGKGCTDVMVNRRGCRVLGHNEDYNAIVGPISYIVHVTILDTKTGTVDTEKQDTTIPKEEFISFMYPGDLAGLTFAMNKSLIFTINTLCPTATKRDGVPVAVLLRAVLACETIEECQSVMKNEPVGCAYGISINIACIEQEEMYSLEVYPEQTDTRVHVQTIPCVEEGTASACHYFHPNHYKHTEDVDEIQITSRSQLREQRAEAMEAPREFHGVLRILGDTECSKAPIYRTPSETRQDKTVATAVFDISNRMLHVYRSNPKLSRYPCLSLPFL